MKKSIKLTIGIVIFLLLLIIIIWGGKNWFNDRDFKLGLLTDQGIGIISVSKERKMINELTMSPETMIWVPKGLGWYRSDRILKLLRQENKMSLAEDLFFYNFGLVPDIVLNSNSFEGWENNWQLINKWGGLNWLKFKWQEGQMRYKQESQKSNFDEILPRDFSDSQMTREDLKVSIYNASDNTGLASFMAKVLEWSGLTVVGVENYPIQIDNCKVVFSEKEKALTGITFLKNRLSECFLEESAEMSEGNVEIYFGEKFAQMLNYQSYKQEFNQ